MALRRWYEAWNRGDREPFYRLLASDAELHPPRERVTTGPSVYHGREGWEDYNAQLDDLLEGIAYEPEEFLETPSDAIVVYVRVTGKGVGSGAPFEQRAAHVLDMRNGQVARLRVFMRRDEALEAAGLRE